MRAWVSLVLAVVVAPPLALGAQAPAKGTGMVTGQVRIDGKPAARVRIVIAQADNPHAAITAHGVTDGEGRYTLASIPAGRYIVRAHAPAYILGNGERTFQGAGKYVSVGDGETTRGVDFELTPGGVITGRITTPEGEPAVRELVSLLRVDERRQRKGASGSEFRSRMTDDRGAYRIYGLEPGMYIVSAGRSPDAVEPFVSSFRQTYYPSTADPSRAEAVAVAAGGVATGIDIELGDVTTVYMASGRARFADTGAPVAGAFVNLGSVVDGQLRGANGTGVVTDARGEFHVEGLTAGTYRMKLELTENARHFADPITFVVVDRDVNGLEVAFAKGASISGVVRLDATDDPAAHAKLAALYVGANRRADPGHDDDFEFEDSASSRIGADGGFTVGGLRPGTYRIGVAGGNGSAGFHMWGVERDGAPAPDEVEVRGDEDVGNVRITVRYGAATLKGTVRVDGDFRPGVSLWVAVRKPGDGDAYLTATGVDDPGQYLVERVPPGDLEVVALANVRAPGGAYRRVTGKPVRVTISNGATVETNLSIDLREGKGEGK